MSPIGSLLIGPLLSVSMIPSPAEFIAVAGPSAQAAVSEARASIAWPPAIETRPDRQQTGPPVDLTMFALDVAREDLHPERAGDAASPAGRSSGRPATHRISRETPSRSPSRVQVRAQTQEPATGQKSLRPPRRQVLVFKATWCGACQQLNGTWPALRRAKWRVGIQSTDHFRLVDSDQHADLVSRYRITSLPTMVLLENGREIDRSSQVLNAVDAAEFYYGRLR